MQSLPDAERDLAELFGPFYDAIRLALEDYRRDYGPLAFKHCKRTEACIVHCLIRFRIGEAVEASGIKGVTVFSRGNVFVITVQDKYRFKVKKMRGGLSTSNVRTQTVINFTEQRRQRLLIPEPTNLHLGYQPKNAAELLTSKLWITCPNGQKSPWWKIELLPPAASAPTPIRPPAPQDAPSRRVLPKDEKKKTPAAKKDDGTKAD